MFDSFALNALRSMIIEERNQIGLAKCAEFRIILEFAVSAAATRVVPKTVFVIVAGLQAGHTRIRDSVGRLTSTVPLHEHTAAHTLGVS